MSSQGEAADPSEEWRNRRRKTFTSFCFLASCLGAEYSIIIPSLWMYLNVVIKAKEAKTFYGLTLAIYYVSAIIGSFTITRLVDRTRRVRLTILILVGCEIVGNVLYSIPTSAYFPLVGRLIQGLGDVNMSIMTAEVARSFDNDEIVSKISMIVTCFSVSFVVSPAINVIFKYIDVNVLGWQINYGNLPGIFMAVFFILVFIVVSACSSDLSREYDLKQTNQSVAMDINRADRSSDEQLRENKTLRVKPKDVLLHFDFIFLVLLGFLMSLSVVAFLDVVAPIYGSMYFKFTTRDIGILFFATAVLFILSVNIMKRFSHRISEYYFIFIGLAIFMASIVCLLILTLVKEHSFYAGMVLYIAYVLMIGICWCIEQVLLRSVFSKIVPSVHQTFGEGVRRAASSLACIVASLLMPLAIDYLQYVCGTILLFIGASVIVLYHRRDTLMVPKEISI